MSSTTVVAPGAGAAIGIDKLFLTFAVGATAILVALVLLDGQPLSAALILGGFGLGIAFLKAEFSYTASWRRFLTKAARSPARFRPTGRAAWRGQRGPYGPWPHVW